MPGVGEKCRACGCTESDLVETCADPYRVVRCSRCSLVAVRPQPDVCQLANCYGSDYYAEWAGAQALARRELWRRRLRQIRGLHTDGRTLLDVGCGLGTFLELARASGWTVSGTEISPAAAERAGAALGLEVFCGEVWDAGFPEKHFDVVTLWHVLEHVRDPVRVLRAVSRIAKTNGLVVICVPNLESKVFNCIYRVVRGRRVSLFDPMGKEPHLFHFTSATLKQVVGAAGLTVVSIGPDVGQVETVKRTIDSVARLLSMIVRRPWYAGLMIACAPEAGPSN